MPVLLMNAVLRPAVAGAKSRAPPSRTSRDEGCPPRFHPSWPRCTAHFGSRWLRVAFPAWFAAGLSACGPILCPARWAGTPTLQRLRLQLCVDSSPTPHAGCAGDTSVNCTRPYGIGGMATGASAERAPATARRRDRPAMRSQSTFSFPAPSTRITNHAYFLAGGIHRKSAVSSMSSTPSAGRKIGSPRSGTATSDVRWK